MAANDDGFLSRWAKRKEQVRSGQAVAPEPVLTPLPEVVALPVVPVAESAPVVEAEPALAEPLPTMADVALLTRESDYSRFVAAGTDLGVKQAAMKKLFADPHFNLMDGLDTYIDDYGKPDPIPLSMLRQMNQSKILRLFESEEIDEAKNAESVATLTATETKTPPDDDPDLRLQQDDAAGRPGPDQGAGA